MDNVNKTLYIPLYGKSYVSKKGILLHDPTAEDIWNAEGFPLRRKSKSKWLAYHMGMRSRVFDQWLEAHRANAALILHIGCGMDSRVLRCGTRGQLWVDVDFPEVITERRRYFTETPEYRMIGADVRDPTWLQGIPETIPAVVVMEGVSMYLEPQALKDLLQQLTGHFSSVSLLMDCYTVFAAKASRYKNPINEVGVTQVYGSDDPEALVLGTGLHFRGEHDLTPDDLIGQLSPIEQLIFRNLFAGRFAKTLYRLYEFSSTEQGGFL